MVFLMDSMNGAAFKYSKSLRKLLKLFSMLIVEVFEVIA
jgi:hypothetical protein